MDVQRNTIVKKQESKLKDIIVDFVGNKKNPINDEVTIEHITNVFTEEFPEFLLVMAEENWINGYTQALSDMDFMLQQQRASAKSEKDKIDSK
tara:strand:+ start:1454 stop:1732 length:279 start_codon:yes stop_codon:yes gene_type:complete